jgi:hypothetical protein
MGHGARDARRASRLGLGQVLVLLSVVVVVAAACSTPDALGSGSPATPAAGDSVRPEVAEVESLTLPRKTGQPVRRARRTLAGMGLEVDVVDGRGSACVPHGDVLEQRPAGQREVAAGSTVTLVVNRSPGAACGLGLWEPSDVLRRAGGRFVAFARDDLPGPPADTPITLFLGGVRRGIAEEPTDRSAWGVCPPAGSYAGRLCPFSALEVISDWPGPVAITGDPPAHACAHTKPFDARRVGGVAAVTITPDEELDCASYWAVQLAVNDVGQGVAVDLVLAEP